MLPSHDNVTTTAISFQIGKDEAGQKGTLSTWRSPVGLVPIVVYGYVFDGQAVAYSVLWDFHHALKDTWPTLSIALLICWLTLRHGLEPLRRAASQTQAMDATRLDQRMPM